MSSAVTVYQPLDLAVTADSDIGNFPGFAVLIGQTFGDLHAPAPGTSGVNQFWFNQFFAQTYGAPLIYGMLDSANTQVGCCTGMANGFADQSKGNIRSSPVLYSESGNGLSFFPAGGYAPVCLSGEFTAGNGNGPGAAIIGGNQCTSVAQQFQVDTSAGNHSVTGIGFQPDAILVMGVGPTSGDVMGYNGGIGAIGATDGTHQWAWGNTSDFTNTSPNQWREWRSDAFITQPGFSTTVNDLRCSIVSLDVDGFTYNTDAADTGRDYFVHFLAIKVLSGAGIAVGVGTQDDATLTAGFEPDSIFFVTGNTTGNTILGTAAGGVGMAGTDKSAGHQQFASFVSLLYGYIDVAHALNVTNVGFSGTTITSVTVVMSMDVAFTGTGANLTWPDSDAGGRKFGWIAFQVDNVPDTPPSATTGAATSVTPTTATLNGTVTANTMTGNNVSYQFDWGLTTGYGSTTPLTVNGDGGSPHTVTANLTGLGAGVTYHYRTAVELDGCFYFGPDQTFTTPVLLNPVYLEMGWETAGWSE